MRPWVVGPLLWTTLFLPIVPGHVVTGEWALPDDAGDQFLNSGLWGAMNLPAPPNPLTLGAIDLRKTTLGGEDEVGIGFDIEVSELVVGTPAAVAAVSCPTTMVGTDGQAAKFVIRFTINEDAQYALAFVVAGTWEGTPPTVLKATGALGCVYRTAEAGLAAEVGQDVRITLDDASNTYHVWVPKVSLLGRNPKVFPMPQAPPIGARGRDLGVIQPGDKIEDVRVTSYAPATRTPLDWFSTSIVAVTDIAPNDGQAPVYTFMRPMANGVVSVNFEERLSLTPVRADANQTLELRVHNQATGKRILTFEYGLSSPTGPHPEYRLYGPARATIPPRETRLIHMALDVGPHARAGDNVTAWVRAVSAGYPDEVGFAETLVVPGPHLGPGSNALYVHYEALACFGPTDPVVRTAVPDACGNLFLSSLKNDPAADRDGAYSEGFGSDFGNPQRTYVRSRPVETRGAGTSAPLYFDANAPATVEFAYRADQRFENVDFTATLARRNATGSSWTTVAQWTGTRTIESGDSVIKFEAPLKKMDPLLGRGTRFRFEYQLETDQGTAAAPGVLRRGLVLKTGDTMITLPLLELPETLRKGLSLHPLQLANLGNPEDFVNPGRSRLFNVTVFNQGSQAHTVDLQAEADRTGWTATVLPGQRFVLQPGDTIRIGVLATAPADESDGARSAIRLNATDEQGRSTHLLLYTVVVANVELADDASAYRTDEEAKDRLVLPPRGKSPHVPALLVLAIATMVVASRRAQRPGNGSFHGAEDDGPKGI